MPKFTVLLQTSPTGEPGKFVNSLPPVKSPQEPLISGDTVPETWSIEVATLEEVTALIAKQMESLTARVAALEAKLDGHESKDREQRKHAEEAEAANDKAHSDGDKKERSEAGASEAAAGKSDEGKAQGTNRAEETNTAQGSAAREQNQQS
jgi:hypothetical protein